MSESMKNHPEAKYVRRGGRKFVVFSEKRELDHFHNLLKWASEQEGKRQAGSRPREPLFSDAPVKPLFTDPVFSTRGCLITTDGWMADISTKLSLLLYGVCNISPLEAADEVRADKWRNVVMKDGSVHACNDPRLVDFAMRYFDWTNDEAAAPWTDTPTGVVTDFADAFRAGREWISTHQGRLHG